MGFLKIIFALCIGASSILLFIRFVVPQIGVCVVSGRYASQQTTCGGMIRFTGDDIASIYRIELINTPWRRK